MSNKLTNEILINKLQNTLNESINKNDLNIKTNELSNELFETLKIIENCTSCKDNIKENHFINQQGKFQLFFYLMR